jgi:hypothetical protein
LKRPGPVDVRIPLFPTTSAAEGFQLLRTLCGGRGVHFGEELFAELEPVVPPLLTPGAAEALAVTIYRQARASGMQTPDALRGCLAGYRSPVPRDVLDFQISLAVNEASDPDFVPACFAGMPPR